MYAPEYIIIKNFGSIADMRYDFKVNVSQIIQGKNLDDKGQKANGAGKSSFNDAMGFCLAGVSLRGLLMDEMIRDGENESNLEFSLRTLDGKKHLLIKRNLFRKKSQLVQMWLNGNPLHKDDADVTARNKTILDQIDINQKDLLQFFIITKERFKPYFKMSDTEKKEITGRFSNADKVDKVFPKIEADLKTNDNKIITTQSKIFQTQGRLETYKSEKDNYESNSLERKETLKGNIQTSIDTKSVERTEIEKKISVNQQSIVLKNTEIDKLKLQTIKDEDIEAKENILKELETEFENIESAFKRASDEIEAESVFKSKEKISLSNELKELNNDLNQLNLLKAQIEAKLQSSINCPACNHEFILKSDETVEELNDKVKECEGIIAEILLEITNKQAEIDGCLKEIEVWNDRSRNLNFQFKEDKDAHQKRGKLVQDFVTQSVLSNQRNSRTISGIETDIDRLYQFIESYKTQIELLDSKITTLNQDLLDIDKEDDNKDAIQRYTDLIEESEKELVVLNDEMDNLKVESQRLNAWLIRFKSFKSFLANQSIKNIEDIANSYLQKMNSDLSVEISPNNKDKKVVKEKFTEKILRNGFPVGSYGRFSGGERGRIDLGLIMANQTLINSNSNEGLDFILIDEVLESLDSLGIESIIRAMDGIDKTLLLVSQNEINTLPQQTLTLIKKNGTTEIEQILN